MDVDIVARWLRSLDFSRSLWLLPLCQVLHVLEEAPQFTTWLSTVSQVEMTQLQFLVNNAFFLLLTLLACVLAMLKLRIGVFLVLFFSGVFGFWNAFFHAGLTAAFGVYSPGLITGLLLYLPLHYRLNALAFRSGLAGNVLGGTALLLSAFAELGLVRMIFVLQETPFAFLHKALGI